MLKQPEGASTMQMFSAAAVVTGGDFKQINGDYNDNRQYFGTDGE
jgi:hypothetical protein